MEEALSSPISVNAGSNSLINVTQETQCVKSESHLYDSSSHIGKNVDSFGKEIEDFSQASDDVSLFTNALDSSLNNDFKCIVNQETNPNNHIGVIIKKEPIDELKDNDDSSVLDNRIREENTSCSVTIPKSYKCDQCENVYQSKSNLKEHVKSKHEKKLANAEACEVCGRVFHWRRSLVRHMKTHEKNDPQYVDSEDNCSRSSTPRSKPRHSNSGRGKSNGETHLIEVNESSLQESLVEPEMKEKSKPHECLYCGRMFEKPSRLKEHIAGVHEKKNIDTCKVCGKTFYWHRSFKRHMAMHEKDAALEAGVEPGLISDEEDDGTSTGTTYKCPICDKSFNRKEFMKLHLQKVHDAFKDDFTCDKCNKSYSCLASFRRHLATHESRNALACSICEKTFLSARSLKFHMDTHTGNTKFECSKCGRRFGWHTSKRSHEMNCNGVCFAKCRFCSLVFNDRDLYEQHIATDGHSGWFSCCHCKLVISSAKSLQAHLLKCEVERFICNICQFSAAKYQEYEVHIETHRGAAKPPDVKSPPSKVRTCNLCGRTFSKARQLRFHKQYFHNQNVKNKVFKCEKCERTMFTLPGWNKHKRTCKGIKDVYPTSRLSILQEKKLFARAEQLANLYNGVIPYICHICKKGFLEMKVLSIHVRKHTTSEFKALDTKGVKKRNYFCDTCNRKFSTYMVYAKHMKSEIHRIEVAGHEREKLEGRPRVPDSSNQENVESDTSLHDSYNMPMQTTIKREARSPTDEANETISWDPQSEENTSTSTLPKVILHDVFDNTPANVKQEYVDTGSVDLVTFETKYTPTLPNKFEASDDEVPGLESHHDVDDGDKYAPSDNDEYFDNIYAPEDDASEGGSDNDVQSNDKQRITLKISMRKVKGKRGRKKGVKSKKTDETDGGDNDKPSQKKKKTLTYKHAYTVLGREGEKGKVKVQCKECNMILNQGSFNTHYRIHTGELPYKCQHCDKGFRTSGALRDHTVYKHTKETPYGCDVCGKRFKDRKMKRYHDHIHKGTKPHKCDLCNYSTQSLSNLKVHKNLHLGLKEYQCSYCGKKFAQNANLQQHMAYVHEGGIVATCKKCGENFANRISLYRHSVRAHPEDHKDREYICEYCSKVFIEKSKFKLHVMTHTGEKPFSCAQCDNKGYYSKQGLKAHMLTAHGTGEYPCVCEKCGKGHLDRTALRRHMEQHDKQDSALNSPERPGSIASKSTNVISEQETDNAAHSIGNELVRGEGSEDQSHQPTFPVNEMLPIIYCPHCGQVFRDQALFDRHVAEHLQQAALWHHQQSAATPAFFGNQGQYQNL